MVSDENAATKGKETEHSKVSSGDVFLLVFVRPGKWYSAAFFLLVLFTRLRICAWALGCIPDSRMNGVRMSVLC